MNEIWSFIHLRRWW